MKDKVSQCLLKYSTIRQAKEKHYNMWNVCDNCFISIKMLQ